MTNRAQTPADMIPALTQPVIVRGCCQCGKLDYELPGPEDDPSRHFVQIELRHLESMRGMERAEDRSDPLKILRMKRRGWRFRDRCACHGKPAVDRLICMDCLNQNAIQDTIQSEYRRVALAMEKPKTETENFYLALCDVQGE